MICDSQALRLSGSQALRLPGAQQAFDKPVLACTILLGDSCPESELDLKYEGEPSFIHSFINSMLMYCVFPNSIVY